ERVDQRAAFVGPNAAGEEEFTLPPAALVERQCCRRLDRVHGGKRRRLVRPGLDRQLTTGREPHHVLRWSSETIGPLARSRMRSPRCYVAGERGGTLAKVTVN